MGNYIRRTSVLLLKVTKILGSKNHRMACGGKYLQDHFLPTLLLLKGDLSLD